MSLSSSAIEVLRESQCEDTLVRLPARQLARPLYEEVNEVLTRLGGKWKSGRTRAHVFPYDPAPLLQGVVAAGVMPPKNPLAFFATPDDVIYTMLGLAEIERYGPLARILEPSAGMGAILDAVRAAECPAELVTVELDPIRAAVLRSKGYDVHELDFLLFQAEQPVDLVLMNPPFAVEGNKLAYIDHIRHAWSLLAPDGMLVAVAPSGFTYRDDRKCAEFRDLVRAAGGWEDNPREAFKESGTTVATVTLWMNKG
jgi:predicted RNA methylase